MNRYTVYTASNMIRNPKGVEYKHAAAILSKLIVDGVEGYDRDGLPYWKESITVADADCPGHSIVQFWHGNVRSWDDVPAYNEMRYIVAAALNAVAKVREIANEWMSYAEVETELGLSSGVVRQRISRYDDFEARGLIKQADKRTWLIKRGIAYHLWGIKGHYEAQDIVGYDRVFKNHLMLADEAIEALASIADRFVSQYGTIFYHGGEFDRYQFDCDGRFGFRLHPTYDVTTGGYTGNGLEMSLRGGLISDAKGMFVKAVLELMDARSN